ncbi:hypothetical protein C8R45DRAFT_944303 [Mycena sanguinolenta]|nr:hypothetical protein C8R45DRAFT_944303 [Mycena sanguinolenta]
MLLQPAKPHNENKKKKKLNYIPDSPGYSKKGMPVGLVTGAVVLGPVAVCVTVIVASNGEIWRNSPRFGSTGYAEAINGKWTTSWSNINKYAFILRVRRGLCAERIQMGGSL